MPSNAHLYNNAPTSYTYNNLTNYQTNLIIHNCKLKSRYLSSAKSSAREVKLSGQDRIAALLLLLTRIEYHCRFRTIHHQLHSSQSVFYNRALSDILRLNHLLISCLTILRAGENAR